MRNPSLKKSLGQHHLRDSALCQPLIDFLQPEGESVIEIGAGGGVLTTALAAAGGQVIACELDLDWAFTLRRRLRVGRDGGNVRVVMADAARLDWRRLPQPTLVTGNLPFNVGTRLIEQTLGCFPAVPRAAFMVQKEVGERLVAGPGDSAYGSLSVLAAASARVRYLGTIRPGSFQPPPKVAAAYVGFDLKPRPLPTAHMPGFVRLVRQAFAHRRKTLRNSLSSSLGRDRADELLLALGWNKKRRAEDLDVAAFVDLYAACQDLSDL